VRSAQQLSALQVEGPEPLGQRGRGALRLLHGPAGQQRRHGQRGWVSTILYTILYYILYYAIYYTILDYTIVNKDAMDSVAR